MAIPDQARPGRAGASFGEQWLASSTAEQTRWKALMEAARARHAGTQEMHQAGPLPRPDDLAATPQGGYVSPTPDPLAAYNFRQQDNDPYSTDGPLPNQQFDWTRDSLEGDPGWLATHPDATPAWEQGKRQIYGPDKLLLNQRQSRPMRFEVQDGLDRYARFRQDLAAQSFGGSQPR
jgi:hypothetical protein